MAWPHPHGFDGERGRLHFGPPPASASAVLCALLEPLVAVLVFMSLAATMVPSEGPQAPSSADLALLLLMLALTYPSPDRLFAPRLQRWSEALVNAAMLAGVLLVCAWATRGLQSIHSSLWAAWALINPLAHQTALELVAWGWNVVYRPRAAPTAIILGTGALARRTARALQQLRGAQRRKVLGWVDPRMDTARNCPASRGGPLRKRSIMGLQELERLLRAHAVDELYLCMPSQQLAERSLERVWAAIQDSTVSVRWIPDLWNSLVIQGQVSTLDGMPQIGILESPFTGARAAIKRASDLLLALAALVLLWPLMLVIALAIRWETPGPALFRQRRLGARGEVIEVWKFRTMTVMDDGPHMRQASRTDTRVTRLGRLLRRTSLDELPQFFNVLQGRMSVVGPRPHALAHNEQYRGLVMAYMVRHKVRPGITGWAQVHGLRGETDIVDKMQKRVEHDLYYLQNWSLALDLQIVLRTVGLVFRDAHAW